MPSMPFATPSKICVALLKSWDAAEWRIAVTLELSRRLASFLSLVVGHTLNWKPVIGVAAMVATEFFGYNFYSTTTVLPEGVIIAPPPC